MPDQARRIIVVDNCSNDGSIEGIHEWLKEKDCSVICAKECDNWDSSESAKYVLLHLSENRGYAAGNNAGIKYALQDTNCNAVWILNNDTYPEPYSLFHLCNCLSSSNNIGMAGSTIVYINDTSVIQCASGFYLNKFFGTTTAALGKENRNTVINKKYIVENKLDYISGASLIIKRDTFKKIGYLAEEYFLYYEDTEFGLRARKYGYTLGWAPKSTVCHREGGTSGASSGQKGRAFSRSRFVDYLTIRNRTYLMRMYFPLMLPTVLLGFMGVILRRIKRGQLSRIPLLFKAVFDGLKKRVGKPSFKSIENKTRNVLFITARADFGGGPEHLWQLVKYSPDNTICYIACPKDYPYYDRFCSCIGADNVTILPHRRFNILSLLRLYFFCRKRNVTVIHSHGKGAGLYGRLLSLITRYPCIHTFHGIHCGEYGVFRKKLYFFYERCMSFITKIGIAVSEEEFNYINEKNIMPLHNILIIKNGVNIPQSNIEYHYSTPYRIISISSFNYQKNTLFLYDVLLELKKINKIDIFKFFIIGDGPDKEVLINKLRQNKMENSVCFVGTTLFPQEFFSNSLCYFSSSRWEGLSLAVLEAMAHGLPPVVSAVIGNQSAVTHGETGFLYHEGNAAQAVEALCRLADDSNLKKRLGLQARMHVFKNHDVHKMALATWKILYLA